ncbi:RNA-binding protein [Floricoccus penangensis]|uniref:YlmH family RNA-binding protein n=1 Tax=Floricoccus penangensis TaxID=1859475 RepID=UPI00203ABC35|nr:YlmH/Sll1252 family protein [Floricoccus penangensis]URZ87038.1 cell division protein [Floricoccus penangensis]
MNEIYQHFKPEEKAFIDRASDWIDRVKENYEVISTNFLNPREVEILKSLANGADIKIFSSFDIVRTEMVKVILAPNFYELTLDDFQLSLIEIDFPSKFAKIGHPQILGTILGQTGLERNKIGDILVSDSRAQFFVDSKFTNLLSENISKIGKLGVKLYQVPFDKLITISNNGSNTRQKVLVVSSLRLDKLVASSFNISRKIAADLIDKGFVKLNYSLEARKETILEIDDLVSVRGYGRFTLINKLSLSKKDKNRVEVEITNKK